MEKKPVSHSFDALAKPLGSESNIESISLAIRDMVIFLNRFGM